MNFPLFFTVSEIFLLFCAFFSATEIAFTSLNRKRLEKRAEKSGGAKVALRVSDGFNVALSTILIGTNLVNIGLSSLATVICVNPLGQGLGATVASAAVTVLVLVFGEIIPKTVAKRYALVSACRLSVPILVLMILFRPLTWIIVGLVDLLTAPLRKKKKPSVTNEELATMIETAEEEGVIDEDKSELVQSALGFAETTVEDILIPRVKVDMLDADDDYEENLKKILAFSHSRIPVYRGTVDHIIGILSVNHFYKKQTEAEGMRIQLSDLLLEPCFVHKTMRLPAALSEMQSRQTHMMVVLDEYGGTMGIVTIEDILEQIVGDIWDENDTITYEITKTGENTYDVDGLVSIDDFFDYIDMDRRDLESEYVTMGGWAIEMLESDPHEGDSFTWRNLCVSVTAIKDYRVSRLSVVVNPESDEDGEE
ncbi:MAG: HlyC/CorC family transporter [Clostridia bacterium]|nr:HlyC/CorC family transporter [Clostridia bacterium]